MEIRELKEINSLIPFFLKQGTMWVDYDKEADTLYLHFKKPNYADNSIMVDENTIVRYEKEKVIGITLLNASKRQTKSKNVRGKKKTGRISSTTKK